MDKILLTIFGLCFSYSQLIYADTATANDANLISNAGFEAGDNQTNIPTGWGITQWQPTSTLLWDKTVAHSGSHSVKIIANSPNDNDAAWVTTSPISITPQTFYRLSGWIKTEQVNPEVLSGANISLYDTWTHTSGITGSHDWSFASTIFNSGTDTQAKIGARLGYWAATTTGTAWFDDLALVPIKPVTPHPDWKILVLIYANTDFSYTDDAGVLHHYTATMSQAEINQAAENATLFVTQDIPVLNSGNMSPKITVRYPTKPLVKLSQTAGGWYPSPEDTAAERDPDFDSVIVIWDQRATDQTTAEYKSLNDLAGLTPDTGTGQAYFAMIIDSAANYGHRNVFKHEWGHSILSYFAALGVLPAPLVTNHATAGQYVHCPTGQAYTWVDEDDTHPAPNSIYSNTSGFTHDYYSGTVATADQPTRCLGITPEAWAYGGPVSYQPGTPPMPQLVAKPDTYSIKAAPSYSQVFDVSAAKGVALNDLPKDNIPERTFEIVTDIKRISGQGKAIAKLAFRNTGGFYVLFQTNAHTGAGRMKDKIGRYQFSYKMKLGNVTSQPATVTIDVK